MRVLLVSTYDLGRQPLGLASPAARLIDAGVDVRALDVSREPLSDADITAADRIAFYLPMHTATRLAMPLVDRVRAANPDALLAAYGLYAPLNAAWLRERGVAHVFGPNEERALIDVLAGVMSSPERPAPEFVAPNRSLLLPLSRYAALQMPDGSRRVAAPADATHGCKHLCRHCPIVPIYRGMFRAVPVDRVMADVRAQVDAGAAHITFGDPDFFNGPTHARRLVERLAAEHPGVSYDVTIKIEHLLAHASLLPVLQETGCLFITSAVESVDDVVLEKLRKGHSRADFIRAVDLCRQAGLHLVPTFVPFTPWTTLEGYRDLIREIAGLELITAVAPIQLAIRLLITAQSALLELDEIQALVAPFDATGLVWPWQHADPEVDALQREMMRIAANPAGLSRERVFEAMAAAAGVVEAVASGAARSGVARPAPPYMTEAWYCCAEPGPEQLEIV
jgi:radical SAM superfamily enzyme YgiQ (UPF0313 family)